MYAAWGIGLLALRQGDLPRALPLLERAVDICRDADLPNYFPRVAPALGAGYTLCGRVADAVPLLERGLEQAMALERVDLQAFCRLALGEAQLLAGHLKEAQALALADELGMRPLQAHCHLGLGTLYSKTDRREPAHAELSTAIDLYRAMAMTFWLAQAEAALTQRV
jgi:tetratricopeptide (TPR) repeat protein